MMKFAKRQLCLFLAVLLVLSGVVANVYAAPQENGTAETILQEDVAKPSAETDGISRYGNDIMRLSLKKFFICVN